jgi:hypothetical protein
MTADRMAFSIQDPAPLGDVTIAPPAMTGRTVLETARAMAGTMQDQPSSAEALRGLRKSFPQASLATRVAALQLMMRGARPAV